MSMRKRLTSVVAAALFLACTAGIADAAPFRLVKDVAPGSNDGTGRNMVALDSNLFFWGYDVYKGQPWLSDGTTDGTQPIVEILGSSGSFESSQKLLVESGLVYFFADAGFGSDIQLWRSDGTPAGTFALSAARSGGLGVINGTVIFSGSFSSGSALMRTDGTVSGTTVLSSTVFAKSGGLMHAGKLIFEGSSQGPDDGFIVTDGTAPGTSFIAVPGLTGFGVGNAVENVFAAVNETVYFVGIDSAHGAELWKMDATGAFPSLVKDLNPGTNSSYPVSLTRVDDTLFFAASTPDAGRELWMSDGTDVGTIRVLDVHPGLQDSSPGRLTATNGILYFVANDGSHGAELWRSDGTGPGTTLALGDWDSHGTNGAFGYTYNSVQAINHKLALVAGPDGAQTGTTPYVSDGTLAGTQLMDATQKIFSGPLTKVNGMLFTSGGIGSWTYGNELIATDAIKTFGNIWCANPEAAIPDNAAAGMNSSFHLPSDGGISQLKVSVDIGHTWIGDLTVSLRHEQTGTTVTLFDPPAGCKGDLMDIVLDDSAPSSVQTTCSNTRLAYPRDQSFVPANPLAAFNGESLQGDWTLNVADNAGGDFGVLHEWCMQFTSDLIFADGLE